MNHYGVYVNQDEPTTGVYNSNSLVWEFLYSDEICLDCKHNINEHHKHTQFDEYSDECPNCLECESYCLDWLECDSNHDKLLGDWILDTKTGLYKPDKNGEFSAIERESVVQVIWSKTVKTNVGLCSPCYPGQADMNSTGDFKAYSLPDWAIYQD